MTALAYWIAVCSAAPPAGTRASARAGGPIEGRFRKLLAVAMLRAHDRGRGILVVAKPGWSYDHARTPTDAACRLMQRAGFAVFDRIPDGP